MMPQVQTACSGASLIARVVLAMLSAPGSRSLPMDRFRKAAIARGALPVWTVEASSAITTSLTWRLEFSIPPVSAHVSSQVSGAGLVGIEAGDDVDRLPGPPLAALLAAPVDAQGRPRFRKGDPAQVRRDGHGLDRAGLPPPARSRRRCAPRAPALTAGP